MPKTSEPRPKVSKSMFTRLKLETAAGLEELAKHYRVTPSDLIRWAAEDLVSGKYRPEHLAAQ